MNINGVQVVFLGSPSIFVSLLGKDLEFFILEPEKFGRVGKTLPFCPRFMTGLLRVGL